MCSVCRGAARGPRAASRVSPRCHSNETRSQAASLLAGYPLSYRAREALRSTDAVSAEPPPFVARALIATMRRVAGAATLYHRDGCAVTAPAPH